MDADGNHVLDANGNPISTTTDASGNYSFIDLRLASTVCKRFSQAAL